MTLFQSGRRIHAPGCRTSIHCHPVHHNFIHHNFIHHNFIHRAHQGAGILGLVLLTTLAVPVAAQRLALQSGDNVTVSAAGTQGIYQGQPINNAVSNYGGNPDAYIVTTNDNSQFTLGNGGSLLASGSGGFGLFEYGGSALITGGTISGGEVGAEVQSALLTITGGRLSGSSVALFASTGSTTRITGGDFVGVSNSGHGLAAAGGNVEVSGGTFSGGSAALEAFGGGVLDLFGTFNGYGSGDTITSGSGTITGTLLDGQALSDTYSISNSTPGSRIEFNVGTPPAAVPELSSAGSLGVGLAFLGVLGVAGRKRGRQAALQLGQQ